MKRKIRSNILANMHALENIPPSCINLGDDGTPKTAKFGDETRGRVSSQAWKHAIRKYFSIYFSDEWKGQRTLCFGKMVADIIAGLEPKINDPFALASEVLARVGVEMKEIKKVSAKDSETADKTNDEAKEVNEEEKDSGQMTKAIFFGNVAQANAIANLAVREYRTKVSVANFLSDENGKPYSGKKIAVIGDALVALLSQNPEIKEPEKTVKNLFALAGIKYTVDKKRMPSNEKIPTDLIMGLAAFACEECDFSKEAYEAALQSEPSMDMVLFGRMFAKNNNLNIDACCQVAHALTTNVVQVEWDYYCTIDELKGTKGAAMIGEIPYFSGTLYRFTCINVTDLVEYDMGESVPDIVQGYLEAFAKSMPTGKINSFGNSVLPEYIYLTVCNDRPLNLVNAFERPIVSDGEGIFLKSEFALANKAQKIYDSGIVEKPAFEAYMDIEGDGPTLGTKMRFDEMLEALNKYLTDRLYSASENKE